MSKCKSCGQQCSAVDPNLVVEGDTYCFWCHPNLLPWEEE